jgi:low affinity Fe/Cu permease
MVFLIQSTQNRDTEAIQVKPDELIRPFGHVGDRRSCFCIACH